MSDKDYELLETVTIYPQHMDKLTQSRARQTLHYQEDLYEQQRSELLGENESDDDDSQSANTKPTEEEKTRQTTGETDRERHLTPLEKILLKRLGEQNDT